MSLGTTTVDSQFWVCSTPRAAWGWTLTLNLMKVDITQQDQVQQLFAGPGKDVDVLVNSAGTM